MRNTAVRFHKQQGMKTCGLGPACGMPETAQNRKEQFSGSRKLNLKQTLFMDAFESERPNDDVNSATKISE